jgi:hypothetical protein
MMSASYRRLVFSQEAAASRRVLVNIPLISIIGIAIITIAAAAGM